MCQSHPEGWDFPLSLAETRVLKSAFVLAWLWAGMALAAGPACAQPHYFRHYQVEEGLSNNAVICSLLDRRGFLWFGTKDGLNRFDGYTFKVFRHDTEDSCSLGSDFITSLYEDAAGGLWAGTEQGLYRYDPATEHFEELPQGPVNEVRIITGDGRGGLWFIAGLQLFRYNPGQGGLRAFPPEKYFQATSLARTAAGHLWISTADGRLLRYDEAADRFEATDLFSHSPEPPSRWIEKIFDTGKGFLLVGTSNQGVKLFDLRNGSYRDILTYNEDKTAIFARTFARYGADEYWIGTESGIFIYHLNDDRWENLQKHYNDPYSLSDNAVYTFCRDREGGMWAGTYFGGLNYYPRPYVLFEKYFPQVGENSLSGNAVREICPDRYGNLWIGTEDGGLNRLDPASGRFTVFRPDGRPGSLANRNIHGLLITGDTLWAGTFEHGLDLLDIRSGRVFRHYAAGTGPRDLKSNFIYSIYRSASGEVLLGTARGLYAWRRDGSGFRRLEAFPDAFYTALFEEDDGTLWAGTYREGLYVFNPRSGEKMAFSHHASQPGSLSNNRVNRIFQDSEGHMWFATEGGLCRLNPDRRSFTRFTTRDGLPSNVVYAMLEDDDKNLWVSTSRGLLRFGLRDGSMRVFSKENGLLSDQFNYNSAYQDSSGRMYFGCVKGMISFDPGEFLQSRYTPPVYITGFQVYNEEPGIGVEGSPLKRSVLLTDTLVLRNNQSTFSIDFAALGYTSPEMTQYAYLMEGLDEDWTYLKTNRKAYFTKLQPGHYVFRVRATNSSGVWNQAERRLVIHILPPFWRSRGALLLYALLAGLATWLGVRSYHRRLEERNARRLERMEYEKQKEVYRAKMEFFTNVAHEIRTPLTLIKGPMEKIIRRAEEVPQIKNNLRIMERNTERLLALTGQLLDFRQTETGGFSLTFVRADLVALLKDDMLRFKPAADRRNIRLKAHWPAGPCYACIDVEAFHKIISNLLDNALKYGRSKVLLTLSDSDPQDSHCCIQVKSDGEPIPPEMGERIFEPFFRLKDTHASGTGIGLALSRSLAVLHKGVLFLDREEEGMNVFTLRLPRRQES